MTSAIETTDMHTAGEPVRIVTAGYPRLIGADILAKRRDAQNRFDHLRRRLMLEPRGHADMYGVIPVESNLPNAAFGVLFAHNSGYSTMCGHATIAIGRWAVETGRVQLRDGRAQFILECPCGAVDVDVTQTPAGLVTSFVSVPAFLYAAGVRAQGALFDIVYGGAYYAIAPAAALGLDLRAAPLGVLRAAAMDFTASLRRDLTIHHPGPDDLGFLYGTILTDGASGEDAESANLCVFAEGQIDRSPTGSGVTARMALAAATGAAHLGDVRRFAGPSGVSFSAELVEICTLAERQAVRVRVSGMAHNSGRSTFLADAEDQLADGFTLSLETPVEAWTR
jgi:trans-L-3-hydroxyproline dehydratase